MTVEEALEFFKAVPRVRDRSRSLHRVGLDYLHVGQQATTLSGGEAQRVKLAKELRSAPPAAPSTSSTSRRPAYISTTSRNCSRCCTSSSRGQHRGGHRAQSRGDQDRRLDHRPRPRRRRRRRRDRRRRRAGRHRAQKKRSYTGAFFKPVLARRAKERGNERGKNKRIEAAE